MQIIIEGKPKEIAVLVLAVQGQQLQQDISIDPQVVSGVMCSGGIQGVTTHAGITRASEGVSGR